MAWEWVGPVATAAVGVAGVTATWLTSRSSGEVQLNLFKQQRLHEGEDRTRLERKEAFASFLALITETQRLIVEVGEAIVGPWDAAAEAANWKPGMPGHGVGYLPDPILLGMSDEERGRAVNAGLRASKHYTALDRHIHEIQLCASDRTISAALEVRRDYDQVLDELQKGQFRVLRATVLQTLLNAFRVDLGYPETTDASVGAERSPQASALDLK